MGSASPQSAFRRAQIDLWPLLLPAVPFGLVLGVVIAEGPINNFVGWSSSWIIFAGAAQLTVVTLIAAAAGPFSVIVSGLVVNARHLMYSAAMAPVFRHQPRWFRYLAPYTLIDQIFVMATQQADADPAFFRRYYLTAGGTFWLTWQLLVGAGILLGAGIPEEWSLDFAVPVLFLGLTVIGMVRRPAIVAAVVGFAVAVVASPLPNRSGLLVGAFAGILAGALVDRDEL
jgi:4-azaleucine resistance transporter AzlC